MSRKATAITLNNSAITVSAITRALSKAAKSHDTYAAEITLAVSAAAAHAGLHGNLNPIRDIFDAYRTKAGRLNKQGVLLKSYTLQHYPALAFNADDVPEFKTVIKQVDGVSVKSPVSPASRKFWTDGERNEDNGKVNRFDMAEGFTGFTPYAQWLEAFNESSAAANEDAKPKAITANQLTKRLEALANALDGAEYKGTAAEWQGVADQAAKLIERIYGMTPTTDVGTEDVLHPQALDVPGGVANQPNGGKKGHKEHAAAGKKRAA